MAASFILVEAKKPSHSQSALIFFKNLWQKDNTFNVRLNNNWKNQV